MVEPFSGRLSSILTNGTKHEISFSPIQISIAIFVTCPTLGLRPEDKLFHIDCFLENKTIRDSLDIFLAAGTLCILFLLKPFDDAWIAKFVVADVKLAFVEFRNGFHADNAHVLLRLGNHIIN